MSALRGPWREGEQHETMLEVLDADGGFVCEVKMALFRPHEDREAIKRVIVAAPELLAELKFAGHYVCESYCIDPGPEHSDECRRLKGVITKAESARD